MKVDFVAIGAHPDDVELSAAGTLMKEIEQGKTVALIDLTEGELGSRGTIETRYEEAAAASKIMGVTDRVNLNLGDGFFDLSQENKIKIIEQIRYYQPEVVFVNAKSDRHPDHGRGAQLAKEACFLSGLVKIETSYEGAPQKPWRPKIVLGYIQDRYLEPNFVVDITAQVPKKIEAILAYKTQFYNPDAEGPQTPISGEDFIDFLKGRWAGFGRSIGVDYAEGFTVDRTIGIKTISDII
ncbi:bacillithiol biosynthesis deacetylase BshB1 [Crocinitomix catalasitica]|uniref:bacillithiol biosynthesis deacetylase BshB1 n=1 Tax=Crocinitomix catalasitica TaxID=184607 RepID=UPI0004875DA0|nr:bacillithiol biosynthesis deacetylase BshB1 [Crocinitomix catalasitica]